MLYKNKIFDSQIIILATTTKEGRAKDGEIIDKEEIKDGKIIEGIDKIKMANLVKMGITKIIIIEIMETTKRGFEMFLLLKMTQEE
jgi:hypothetical protein